MSDDYDVGFGKPPKDTQFRKGRSGNPRGRPKGTKNLKADLLEELQELISVREGNTRKMISKQRALVKSLIAKAVQGDPRAANAVLQMLYRLAFADEATESDIPLASDDLAVLESYKARIAASTGVDRP